MFQRAMSNSVLATNRAVEILWTGPMEPKHSEDTNCQEITSSFRVVVKFIRIAPADCLMVGISICFSIRPGPV